MTGKTGTTVAVMQTEGVMTAAVDTGARPEAPELVTGIGAADMTTVIIGVITESMTLEPGTTERNTETEAPCVIATFGKVQAEKKKQKPPQLWEGAQQQVRPFSHAKDSKIDFEKAIPGYAEMTPAERMKARTKLLLDKSAKQVSS